MKQFELKGIKREHVTKGQMNDLKAQGYVPAVLYGDQIEENINMFFFINDLNDLIYTDDVYQVNLIIDGKTYKTVIKSIQFHPLSDQAIHVDFMTVSDDKVIKIWYPIHFVGTAAGIMQGGKLFKRMRKIRVKGKVSDLPNTLEINISSLNVGENLKIRDISIPNVEILIPEATPIASVTRPRGAAALIEEEEGETEADTTAEE